MLTIERVSESWLRERERERPVLTVANWCLTSATLQSPVVAAVCGSAAVRSHTERHSLSVGSFGGESACGDLFCIDNLSPLSRGGVFVPAGWLWTVCYSRRELQREEREFVAQFLNNFLSISLLDRLSLLPSRPLNLLQYSCRKRTEIAHLTGICAPSLAKKTASNAMLSHRFPWALWFHEKCKTWLERYSF